MRKKDKVVVVLDAGHGGISPETGKYVTDGKRSPKWRDMPQYFEGVGNREIVAMVSEKLDKLAIHHEFTVHPHDWNDMPLWERKGVVNHYFRKYRKENKNVFSISIHSNGFKKPSARGAEVWTWPGQTMSDPMAEIWMEEHAKMFPDMRLRTDSSDGDMDKESKFAMNSVRCPSFLIESMFHTNKKECAILNSKEGKEKIAQGIVNAIVRIIEELY
jgi:N-acetylmuramoyl-L-alanine amidase